MQANMFGESFIHNSRGEKIQHSLRTCPSTITGLPYGLFTARISRIREHLLCGFHSVLETASFDQKRGALVHERAAKFCVYVRRIAVRADKHSRYLAEGMKASRNSDCHSLSGDTHAVHEVCESRV